MAMPMDYDGMRTDDASERTDDVDVYRRTCIEFIESISHDYEDWVDYYKLPDEEQGRRKAAIHAIIPRTGEWIAKVAQTIKAVDVVMNDGIQKMAESTAARPFPIGVFVNKTASYAEAGPGIIEVNVKASGREGRKARLGFHFQADRFRIESTCGAYIEEDGLPLGEFEMMDLTLKLHAENAKRRDVISFTVTVCEVDESGTELDKRGLTTIVHIV